MGEVHVRVFRRQEAHMVVWGQRRVRRLWRYGTDSGKPARDGKAPQSWGQLEPSSP